MIPAAHAWRPCHSHDCVGVSTRHGDFSSSRSVRSSRFSFITARAPPAPVVVRPVDRCVRKKARCERSQRAWIEIYSRQRPTLPHTCACSTIGGGRLNFRVRNGNGWNPAPMTTGKLVAWGPAMWSAVSNHASSHCRSSQTIFLIRSSRSYRSVRSNRSKNSASCA